jgi:hypothetical protein
MPDMTPREAYERLVAGDIEAVPVHKLAKRTRGQRSDALNLSIVLHLFLCRGLTKV